MYDLLSTISATEPIFLQNSFHIGRVDWKKKITMPMMLKGHPDMYFNDSDKKL